MIANLLRFGKSSDANAAKGRNAALDPKLIDYSIGDRADRNAAQWRQAFYIMAAVALIAIVAVYAQSRLRHDYVAVFREDSQGVQSYIGQATDNAPPSNQYGVEKALADWVKCFRNIPNNDPVLVQQNGNCVFALIPDQGSQAYKLVVHQLTTYPPKTLNEKNRIHRDVDKVVVSAVGNTLAYNITWVEYIYQNGDLINTLNQNAQVTLAGVPQAPTGDPNIARLNPEGIVISTIDPHWNDSL